MTPHLCSIVAKRLSSTVAYITRFYNLLELTSLLFSVIRIRETLELQLGYSPLCTQRNYLVPQTTVQVSLQCTALFDMQARHGTLAVLNAVRCLIGKTASFFFYFLRRDLTACMVRILDVGLYYNIRQAESGYCGLLSQFLFISHSRIVPSK